MAGRIAETSGTKRERISLPKSAKAMGMGNNLKFSSGIFAGLFDTITSKKTKITVSREPDDSVIVELTKHEETAKATA